MWRWLGTANAENDNDSNAILCLRESTSAHPGWLNYRCHCVFVVFVVFVFVEKIKKNCEIIHELFTITTIETQ